MSTITLSRHNSGEPEIGSSDYDNAVIALP
jgi:hypothetical protein